MNPTRQWRWQLPACLLLFGVSLFCLPVDGDAHQKPSPLKELMQSKLKQSQLILEGIAVEDFDKLASSSDRLLLITQQAEWLAFDDDQYRAQSDAFRRAVKQIGTEARRRNVDGAAMGYVQMTLACVNCHKAMRGDDVRK